MDTIKKLSDYANLIGSEIKFMGVPKTIDNDLMVTDHTPGFGSAAKYIAVTVQEIIRDCAVYTTKAVTIVEIMGRDASVVAKHAQSCNPTVRAIIDGDCKIDTNSPTVRYNLKPHKVFLFCKETGKRLRFDAE